MARVRLRVLLRCARKTGAAAARTAELDRGLLTEARCFFPTEGPLLILLLLPGDDDSPGMIWGETIKGGKARVGDCEEDFFLALGGLGFFGEGLGFFGEGCLDLLRLLLLDFDFDPLRLLLLLADARLFGEDRLLERDFDFDFDLGLGLFCSFLAFLVGCFILPAQSLLKPLLNCVNSSTHKMNRTMTKLLEKIEHAFVLINYYLIFT